jgi:aminoglycoside phosphotransferase (APT) family kinase protein
LGIIDFDRCDNGDPWEEFNRIVWCAARAPYFASGRIDGYFEEGITESFFQFMALYILVNQVSSVYWAIQYGSREVETMSEQNRFVMDSYDDMHIIVPKWYTGKSR